MSHFNLPPSDNPNVLPSLVTARNVGLAILTSIPTVAVLAACSTSKAPVVQAECTGIAPAIAEDGSLILTQQTHNIPTDITKRYTFELKREGGNATPIRDTEEGPEEDFTNAEDGVTPGRYTAQAAVEFPSAIPSRASVLCRTVSFEHTPDGVNNVLNGNTTPTSFIAPASPRDVKKSTTSKTAARITTTVATTTTTVPKPPTTTSTTTTTTTKPRPTTTTTTSSTRR